MVELLDKRFVFVLGKGGVGRTTVSAALALAASRAGKRVLIAMCNGKERLSHLLEVPPIGVDVVSVGDGVDAVNMTPEAALSEYGMMVLKVPALSRAIFGNRFVSAFLHGTPGIDAWAMLGKAYYHATHDQSTHHDLVILDAPATGHGLDMLRVPQVIVDVAPPGLLRREAEQALALFRDPARSGVALVTLPEDMPTTEAIELHRALVDELRFPVTRLVINAVMPTLFEPGEEALLSHLAARVPADAPLFPLARAGRARAIRERVERENLARLSQALPLPRTELPRLFTTPFRRAAVTSLSQAF